MGFWLWSAFCGGKMLAFRKSVMPLDFYCFAPFVLFGYSSGFSLLLVRTFDLLFDLSLEGE